ncbi:exodeoxyribonuclease V subunit alpha [Paraferrimonas sp. SM1919]|uniref:exodeoxyribonuclease V subunit alpha n=1 Tax=Paraferrimonas sp. SM1919 TaxID=2662263 RepID=UPI001969D207|nr:exodeoxyribonuclease V subunit alpha [Paraferrimonas sp. SM1919]
MSVDMKSQWQMLQQLVELKRLRQLDVQFAKLIAQKSEPQYQLTLSLLAVLASKALSEGHICLPLLNPQGHYQEPLAAIGLGHYQLEQDAKFSSLEFDVSCWRDSLSLDAIKRAFANSQLLRNQANAPLIFDNNNVYLHRYWHYEKALAGHLTNLTSKTNMIEQQLENTRQVLDELFSVDLEWVWQACQDAADEQTIIATLIDLFDVVAPELIDWARAVKVVNNAQQAVALQPLNNIIAMAQRLNWQKLAAAVALNNNFAVISGGPGTGKTTTVTKLLAALVMTHHGQHSLNIKMAAPTGKAAARLTESMSAALASLSIDAHIKQQIPTAAATIHRLLGAIPNSQEFRHNRHNPLHLDVLVVDEASMVDLPLMYKLLEALPKDAKLMLLGDKDQLASVEPGAILGDICSLLKQGYSDDAASKLSTLTGFNIEAQSSSRGIADGLCMLKKSFRFGSESGIGNLARATNEGRVQQMMPLFDSFDDIDFVPLKADSQQQLLAALVKDYQGYLEYAARDYHATEVHDIARQSLKLFSQTRLLCALRGGATGVENLNHLIATSLSQSGLINSKDYWYHSKPVMVSSNDHSQGLFNGDIGLCLYDSNSERNRLKVYFQLADGSIKAVLPARVPAHETAFAMTVHKSQGSEFDSVYLLLPEKDNPILTKELVYTGITRAKSKLTIFGVEDILKRSITKRVQRHAGLVKLLK